MAFKTLGPKGKSDMKHAQRIALILFVFFIALALAPYVMAKPWETWGLDYLSVDIEKAANWRKAREQAE